MSYHMYTTDALVCGCYERNGADRTVLLLTEALGMVYATARSIREERSRQRTALQEFSIARVSLINGRAGWRVGSVEAGPNAFLAADNRRTRAHIVRIIRLLRRYVHGELETAAIYTLATTAIVALADNRVSFPDTYTDVVLYRMLYELGYIAPTEAEHSLVNDPIESLPARTYTTEMLQGVRQAVRAAATTSQL